MKRPSAWLGALLAASWLLLWTGPPGTAEESGPAALEAIDQSLRSGRHADAEEKARAFLEELARREPGEPELEAQVLDLLVEALWRARKPPEAEHRALAERAIELKQRELGPDAPEIATSLDNLGHLLRNAGKYDDARRYFEQSLELRETTLGSDHERVAHSLNQLGWMLYVMGEFEQARNLGERSVRIRERSSPGTADLASSMNNLAVYLKTLGEYSSARDLYERAVETYEKALGEEHVQVARSLGNLAILLRTQGDHAAAIETHQRSIGIYERTLRADHPMTALAMTNLASAYDDIGDHPAATRLFGAALEVFEEELEPDHSWTAATLNNLGGVMIEAGNFQLARQYLERALSIRERTQSSEIAIARVLDHLAELETEIGDLPKARGTLERSLSIVTESLGVDHPDAAEIHERLGEVLHRSGDHDAAREHLAIALDIYERKLGADHPLVGSSLRTLAALSLDTGEGTRALDYALRADNIGREHLRLTARTLPERQALAYAMIRPAGQDVALSVLASREKNDPALTASVWDALVPSRALVLDEMRARHRAMSQAEEPARLMAATSERLANLLVRGRGEQTIGQYQKLLRDAASDREAAERALAEASLSFRLASRAARYRLADVAAALPDESVLLSYVRYDRQRGGEGVPTYMALVLSREGEAQAFPLGPEEALEPLVARWRDQIAAGRRSIPGLRGATDRSYRDASAALRAFIWDPVASLVAQGSRVFVVPDGLLHLVNLSTLPDAQGSYLIETAPAVHYLSTERDLIPHDAKAPGDKGVLLAGGARFGAVDKPQGSTAERECTDFDSIRFTPLPGTVREIETVADLWTSKDPASSVSMLRGREATEDALKRDARGHRVLHLATHGFFVDERCDSTETASAGIEGTIRSLAPPVDEATTVLAGLALAGANLRNDASLEGSDGILTTQEIASLDLTGVEWVVLSACDTALGTIRAGEGVFGLRRAFQVAGAETLITSLWSVEDASGRAWMRRLYEARLDGLASADAVHQASLGVLQARRRDRQSTHPFHWGAFVAVGDWR